MGLAVDLEAIVEVLVTEIKGVLPKFVVKSSLDLPGGSDDFPVVVINPETVRPIRFSMSEAVASSIAKIHIIIAEKLYRNKSAHLFSNLEILLNKLDDIRLSSNAWSTLEYTEISFQTQEIDNTAIQSATISITVESK